MTNGLSIKSKADFKELYSEDPGMAMGLLFQNISDLKEQCACRLETCKVQQRKDRLKNIAAQAGGGVFGGVAAVWAYLKFFFEK